MKPHTVLAHRCSRLFQLFFETGDSEMEKTEMCNLLAEPEAACGESRRFYYSVSFLDGRDLARKLFWPFSL